MSASITYDENRRFIISGIECDCACEHRIPNQDIYVGEDILQNLPQYIKKRNLGTNCVLVCDKNTIKVAGEQVCRILTEAGFDVIMCFLKREGDVDPDERSVGEVLLSIHVETVTLLSNLISEETNHIPVDVDLDEYRSVKGLVTTRAGIWDSTDPNCQGL